MSKKILKRIEFDVRWRLVISVQLWDCVMNQKINSYDDKLLDYPEFLSFTPYDWYVLLRILIFELYDSDPVLWSQDDSEVYIGSALDTLLGNIRTGE